jgi:hypothetical protein
MTDSADARAREIAEDIAFVYGHKHWSVCPSPAEGPIGPRTVCGCGIGGAQYALIDAIAAALRTQATQVEECEDHDQALVWCNECIKIDQETWKARLAEVEAWLDSQEFYELSQAYRHAPLTSQTLVCEAWESLKQGIRNALGGSHGP